MLASHISMGRNTRGGKMCKGTGAVTMSLPSAGSCGALRWGHSTAGGHTRVSGTQESALEIEN